LFATGTDAGATDQGSYNVVGAPSNWDVAVFNQNLQSYDRCAAACFAATYAQGTVSYFSLDIPRNVTIAYNGDRVWPKPFVHLNVQKPSGSTPDTIFLQVKKAGVFQTFTNGETLLKFLAASSGWQRIGGQLRDSTLATGMYDDSIIVTWHYPGGSTTVQTWSTKLLVVSETSSPIARGWTLAGVQRMYPLADSSILLTQGDGSALFFQKGDSARWAVPRGEFSTLGINGTGWKRVYPDSTKVYFNSAGRMTDIYDRFNNRTQFFYDGSNRLTTIRDPNGQDLVLAYGTYGLSSIRDNITPFRYTNLTVPSDSTLAAIQDPDGVSTAFQYDGSRRLWKITDRRGNTTTVAYQVINGIVTGKLATLTSPAVPIFGEGTVSPMVAYAPWQTISVPYSTTASNPVPIVGPDTLFGRVTDPGGHTSKFTVNRWSTAAVMIDALGRIDSIRFEISGLPIRNRASTGAVDSAVYNSIGLPTYVKTAGHPATIIRYAGWGQADSMRTEDGLRGARYYIGANGRVDSVLVAGGTADAAKTKMHYDSRGRPDSVIDPVGHLVLRTWYLGTNGNRSRDSLPGGRVTTYAYDLYGRDTSTTTAGWGRTRTFYSIINRPDSVRDPVNPVVTRYGYDNLFLTSVRDPKGQVNGLAYNAVGWLTGWTDPLGHAPTYEYGRDGELRRWTNRRGQPITYTYDALHRPTGKSGTNTATESWAYPSDTVVVDSSAVAIDTLVTNRYGQSLRASTLLAGQYYVRRYTYTAAGALDSVIPSGGGITFQARHYVWNLQRGALTNINLGPGPSSTATTYTLDGLAASVTFPGGEVVNFGYTSTHAPAGITSTGADSATVNRAAGLDAANRIKRNIVTPTVGHQFSFDSLGRVIADTTIMRQTPCNWGPPFSEDGSNCAWNAQWAATSGISFSYDSAGNRRDLGGTYTTGNRITSFNGCTYVADSLDGNVTSRTCAGQTVTFDWTAESRLASLTANGQTTTFDYNAAGRLVKKTTGGIGRYFLWDGDQLLSELDGTGTAQIAEYSYYPGLDNPHALIVGGSKSYAHADMLGNVIALTDSSGQIQRWYEYDAWGNMTGSSDYTGFNGKDRARYKGALWLGDETEVYYMRNRWYEPRSGRFLSEDPIGLASGTNPYLFAGNDPVNGRDPTGLLCTDWYEKTYYVETGEPISFKYAYTVCDGGGGGGGGADGPAHPGICRAQTLAGRITIDASIAPNAVEFINTAVRAGADFSVNNGFRTTDEQLGLWLEKILSLRNTPVAEPFTKFCVDTRGASSCGSLHEAGFSIDVNWGSMDMQSRVILQTLAPAFGFKQLNDDKLHFQWNRGLGPYGSKENAIVFNQAINEHFPVSACQ
jgi:RHS repeat-associated protein